MSLKKQRMGEQIKLKCFDCQARLGYYGGVESCNDLDCPLWFLRFGSAPDVYIRQHGRKTASLFNPRNF